MNIFFSIVIPAYNAQSFIVSALDCINLQTYSNYEVIIVDNGSTDNTFSLANDYKLANPLMDISIVRVFPNAGISGARNIGTKTAKYDYISYLDVDDYWFPNKLQIVHDVIECRTDIDIIWHWENTVQFESNRIVRVNKYRFIGNSDAYKYLLLNGNQLSASALTIKKKTMLKVNGFSTLYVSGEEDYDCWLRLAKAKASFYLIKRVLGEYRLHGASVSASREKHTLCVHRMLMNHIEVLRQNGENLFQTNIIEKKVVARYYYLIGRINSDYGNTKIALNNLLRSISVFPFSFKTYAAILLVFIGKYWR